MERNIKMETGLETYENRLVVQKRFVEEAMKRERELSQKFEYDTLLRIISVYKPKMEYQKIDLMEEDKK